MNTNSHSVSIEIEKCKGCDLCIKYCNSNCLKKSRKINDKGYYYVEFKGDCKGCRFCELMCPEDGIKVK